MKKKIILLLIALVLIVAAIVGYRWYGNVYVPQKIAREYNIPLSVAKSYLSKGDSESSFRNILRKCNSNKGVVYTVVRSRGFTGSIEFYDEKGEFIGSSYTSDVVGASEPYPVVLDWDSCDDIDITENALN